MTTTVIFIACLGTAVAVYAIHEGVGIKAAIKWLGMSFSFEAEKRNRRKF
jgi:hypothetical protein